jgi:hypothetical protein
MKVSRFATTDESGRLADKTAQAAGLVSRIMVRSDGLVSASQGLVGHDKTT